MKRVGNCLTALGLSAALSATAAGLRFDPTAITGNGLQLTEAPAPSNYRIVEGPQPATKGIAAAGTPVAIAAKLVEPLPGRGSLMFWFRTPQPFATGSDAVPLNHKLITLPGVAAVTFTANKGSITVSVFWEGDADEVSERHIRVILPQLPGPAWHHVAVHWDGRKGESNAFLNGTPYYVLGEKMAPFRIGTGDQLIAHLDKFALADVRISPKPFSPDELRAIVGATHFGTLAGLLGAKELPPIDLAGRRGQLLYERAFAQAADGRDWVLEGPGVLAFRDGWLHMKSELPDGPQGHVVYWCPEVFPERFAAEWEFELLEPKGLCIVFFAARGHHGKDLFDPSLAKRTGVFTHYTNGEMDAYHISYFANTPAVPRAVANLRKNHGFYVLSNGPVGVSSPRAGQTHRALLVKDGAHIQMSVDGRTIIDYTDDGKRAGPVWTDGRIGLRQMQWTNGRYRNFRVYALKPAAN